MSEVFTASNGVDVERADGGDLCIFGSRRDFICHEHQVALREFFLHERDQELGRWRWPENPNYVVYPNPHEDHELAFGEELSLIILRESDGVMKGYAQDEDHHRNPDRGSGFARAARAYFLAHPESKPWHDAETGEVWLLTLEDGEEQPWYVDGGPDFNPIPWHKDIICMNRASSRISAGRKVWPEVSDE